jgi:hypothetical protein
MEELRGVGPEEKFESDEERVGAKRVSLGLVEARESFMGSLFCPLAS